MAEPIKYFSIKRLVSRNDFFKIQLRDGELLEWRNFGQVVKVGESALVEVIDSQEEQNLYVENILPDKIPDTPWFLNAYSLCYGEDPMEFGFKILGTKLDFHIRKEWDSRHEDILKNEEEQKLMVSMLRNHLPERPLSYIQDKVFNWSRPELKTNAPIDLVMFKDEEPWVMGIKEKESRVTYIDAFFRTMFWFRNIKE